MKKRSQEGIEYILTHRGCTVLCTHLMWGLSKIQTEEPKMSCATKFHGGIVCHGYSSAECRSVSF